jgi:hypothetical protein
MRARRPVQLCLSTMARRRLKNPSFVDFVGLSCAPRDFSAIFGTNPFPLAFGQTRVYTRRARRHIVLFCYTMTLGRLKSPFLVDFSI